MSRTKGKRPPPNRRRTNPWTLAPRGAAERSHWRTPTTELRTLELGYRTAYYLIRLEDE